MAAGQSRRTLSWVRADRTVRLALLAGLTALACARTELPFNPIPSPLPTATLGADVAPASATVEPTAPPPEVVTVPPPSATPVPSPTHTGTPTAAPDGEIGYSGEAAAVGYRIPLSVRHVETETALVFFELASPAAGYLMYRPANPSLQAWFLHPLDPTLARHQIALSGLTPATEYRVRVGLGPSLAALRAPWLYGDPWQELTFRTVPEDEPALRFGVIGDSGFGQRATLQLADLMADYGLDLVVHTGDLAYRVNDEADPLEGYARKYFQNLAPLFARMPVYPVPGNHEYDRETYWQGRPYYFHAFAGVGIQGTGAESWYAFARQGIQFLMLDSQVFHGVPGRAAQTAWLSERLADPGVRFSIPVFHIPPFTSGLHRLDGRALAAEWLPRFEAAGVPLVISGHDHNYERILFNGITYLVSGGGSRNLYPESIPVAGSQVFAMQTHFVLVTITEHRILLQAINLDDEVIDRTTIELGPEG